jgi:hypothetical protein
VGLGNGTLVPALKRKFVVAQAADFVVDGTVVEEFEAAVDSAVAAVAAADVAVAVAVAAVSAVVEKVAPGTPSRACSSASDLWHSDSISVRLWRVGGG